MSGAAFGLGLNFGEVEQPWKTYINNLAVHPHVEFLIT